LNKAGERRPRFRRVKPRPFVLTPRDRRIVELVAEYRILSSEQIVALVGEGSSQVILRRLSLLFHGRYLERPRSQIEDLLRFTGSRPIAYALGTAGATLLGLKPPKPVKLPFVDHTLGVSSVLVAFTLSCREHGNVRVIPWREILAEKVPEERRRKKEPDAWKVRLSDGGAVGVKPDAIFGLHYLDKSEGANRAYFFLEVDRGTMPVMRAGLSQTSVYRKLLAYHATAAAGLQTSLFGIKNFRVLTVTRSPEKRRLASLVDAAGKLPSLQGLFLFGEEKTLLGGDVLTSEWISGKKESVVLER